MCTCSVSKHKRGEDLRNNASISGECDGELVKEGLCVIRGMTPRTMNSSFSIQSSSSTYWHRGHL
ncbi:hypothetical protein CY34DRAFT_811853 [Suillus luteus UH-Slu-Lm8-n1]|uniref:Uncharacterized protein n=1 Tax=Suillus luteus UH-Slu-Lm8-n1 TaxID=930992 RepID=A0A0D0AVA6_9AGAM|nr:hypothetical protein CY34DRAFT_811853 [Suillus luteus UH-Slu-Lm8-n1]